MCVAKIIMEEGQKKARFGNRIEGGGTKLLLALVVVVGIGSLGYGAYSIQQSITQPLQPSPLVSLDKFFNIIPPTATDREQEQKNTDTDGDGLSDFDEINIYATSPYLTDSDADGIDDASEITSGTDPNCAPGGDCRGVRLITPTTKISDLFPEFSGSEITLKDKTIQEFRQILLEQGFDAEALAEIDDEVLLIILEESLKLQNQEAESTATSTEDIDLLDLDQVRLLLIELGVPEDEVYSLSNQEVQEILKTFK